MMSVYTSERYSPHSETLNCPLIALPGMRDSTFSFWDSPAHSGTGSGPMVQTSKYDGSPATNTDQKVICGQPMINLFI